MTKWQDGMANNMIGLDNHTNFTVSQKHMQQQSPSSSFISSLSYARETWPHPFLVTSAEQSLAAWVTFLQTHHHQHTEGPFPLRLMQIWYRNTDSYGQNRKVVASPGWRDYTASLERKWCSFGELSTSHRPQMSPFSINSSWLWNFLWFLKKKRFLKNRVF